MQGLKWRLSFHSGRPPKQLKKLWADYCAITGNDKQQATAQFRVLLQLADAVDSARDLSPTIIAEELEQDIPAVLVAMVSGVSNYMCEEPSGDEREPIEPDAIAKLLQSCELLASTTEKPIPNDSRLLCTRRIVACMKAASDRSTLMPLLGTLKKLINTTTLLREFVVLQGLEVIVSVIERNPDSAVVSYARNLLCSLVIGFRGMGIEGEGGARGYSSDQGFGVDQRSRALSTSSTGSASRLSTTPRQSVHRKMLSNVDRPPSANKVPSAKPEPLQEPAQLKGLNYAWNVISEFLKNTPIAGSWFSAPNAADNFDDGRQEFHQLLDDNPYLSNLSLTMEELDIELQRIASLRSEREKLASTNAMGEDVISLQANVGDYSQPIVCVVRGLKTQVLEKLASAQTPADALAALVFLFATVSNNVIALEQFFASGVVGAISDMLNRVELNLSFLLPCNQATRAAAVGADVLAGGKKGDSTSSGEDDFVEYHNDLVVLLVRMLLNDPLRPSSHSSSILFWRGLLIKNFPLLAVLTACVQSKHPSLANLAVRVILTLIAINPLNAVALDAEGVVASLVNCITTFVLRGKFMDASAESSSAAPSHVVLVNSTANEEALLPLKEDVLRVVSAIVETMQVLSVCFSHRDSSLPLLLTWNLLELWSPMTSDASDERNLRCSNCEVEFAVRHCLSESCIVEQCCQLCEECDKVFHKSAIKRSHIRMPLALSEALPPESWEQDLIKQLHPAHRSCVGYSRRLKASAADIREDGLVESRQLFLRRRELVSSLMLAGLKGMWDDRKTKMMPLPTVALRMMVLLSQQIIHVPFFIANLRADISSTEGPPIPFHTWTNLLDDEDPAVANPYDMRTPAISGEGPAVPPEVNHANSRRIILSLSLQVLSRFVLGRFVLDDSSDTAYGPNLEGQFCQSDPMLGSTADSLATLELFLRLGGDALLAHCAIDSSTRTCLTFIDRQFAWWLMRECCLTCIASPARESSMKFLSWFLWILRSDAVISTDSRSLGRQIMVDSWVHPPRPVVGKDARKQSLGDQERVPHGPARIQLSTRLVVLQELRIMISGSNAGISADEAPRFVSLQLPVQTANATPTYSRGSSYDSVNKEEDWLFSIGLGAEKGRGRQMAGPCFSSLCCSLSAKRMLSEMGVEGTLYDLICNERIVGILALPVHAMQDHYPPSLGASSLAGQQEMTELEAEVWWSALVTLSVHCTGFEAAKRRVQERNGLQVLVNLLMKLVEDASICGRLGLVNLDYERALSLFLLELCIGGGQVLCPSKPFKSVLCKLPRTVHGSSDSTPRRGGTPTSAAQQKSAAQLFNRPLCATQELDLKFHLISTVPLSAIYYSTEKLVSATWSAMHPQCVHFPVAMLSFLGSISMTNKLSSSASFHRMDLRNERGLAHRISPDMTVRGYDMHELRSPVDFPAGDISAKPTRRSFSRKIQSSASVHSLDADSRWEMESVGKQSSVHGDQTSRGSFNSHQSVTAVLQAFKNIPIGSIMAADQMDSSSHARSVRSGTDRHFGDFGRGEDTPRLDTPGIVSLASAKGASNTVFRYCDFLSQLCSPGNLEVQKGIVLLHHSLLIRAGLSQWLTDDVADDLLVESPCSKSSSHFLRQPDSVHGMVPTSSDGPPMRSLDGYYLTLQRHLGLFFPQVAAAEGTSADLLNWQPHYAMLEVRDEICLEMLLSSIVAGSAAMQELLLSILCLLMKQNPANAFKIGSSKSLPVVLSKLLPHLSDHNQGVLGSILSQELSYSANTLMVRSLLESKHLTHSTDEKQSSSSSESFSETKILFILGKAIERFSPQRYIHFHGGDAFGNSGLMLPPLSSGQPASKTFSIAMTLQFANPAEVTNQVVFQAVRGRFALQVSVRIVRVPICKADGPSVATATAMEDCSMGRIECWRQVRELCISVVEVLWKDGGSLPITSFSSELQCNRAAVSFLLGREDGECQSRSHSDDAARELGDSDETSASLANLVSLMGGHAFPDAIVDLPTEEEESWHSIVLSFHSSSDIVCLLDGKKQAVRRFSPYGFVDQESEGTANAGLKHLTDFFADQEAALQMCVGSFKLFGAEDASRLAKAVECSSSDADSLPRLQMPCLRLLCSLRSIVSALEGSVAEVFVLDGAPEAADWGIMKADGLHSVLSKPGKAKILVSLGSNELHQHVALHSQNSLVQKGHNLKDDGRVSLHGMKVFSPVSSTLRPQSSSASDRLILESLLKPDESTVSQCSIHSTIPVSQALLNLGGFRCLFPFLRADAPEAIATLRFLEVLVCNEEAYSSFKREAVDRAILYAVIANPKLVNNEVFQAAFDLAVCRESLSAVVRDPPPCTLRAEILESFMDMVIASNNFVIASNAVDWLRDLTYDSPKLAWNVLKTLSLTPFFVLASLWSVGASGSISNFLPETSAVSSTESEKRKVAFVGNSVHHPVRSSWERIKSGQNDNEPEDLVLSRYKLQLSVIRFLRQLLDSMTMEAQMVHALPSMELVNLLLPPILAFGLHFARPRGAASESSLHEGARDAHRRSEKQKTVLRKTCGALPVLRHEVVLFDSYWHLSASLGCWLEVMGLLTGRFGNVFLSMMKNLLPGISLAHMALELFGSPSVELRGIGIRLLIFYLSGPDGKLDLRQVSTFDKANGFHSMAKQLSSHSHACDDLVLDGLFSLLFWQIQGLVPRPRPASVELGKKAEEFLQGSRSSGGPEKEEMDDCLVLPPPAASSANHLQLFAAQPITSDVSLVSQWTSFSTDAALSGRDTTEGVESPSTTAHPPPQSQPPPPSSGAATSNLLHGQNSPGDDRSLRSFSSSLGYSKSNTKTEEIILPHVLESLFCILQCSKSLDQVHRSIYRLHRCLGETDPAASDPTEDVHARNLEAFFSARDWIILLCDMVTRFRRSEAAYEFEGGGVLSMSEPESLMSGGMKRHDSFVSGGESEEGFSAADDSIADDQAHEYLPRRTSSDASSHRHYATQFTTPVLVLLRKVIMLDMFLKCNGNRRWIEIFRLSLPETAQIQEEIVLDIVNAMHHASFLAVSTEQSFNYLKNMGAFLEQSLERIKLSLPFCVSVVSSLHALGYRCCMELRARMKETALPEVKKAFIVRCLIDVGQEIVHRVHCLVEISASLQSYIANNDSKLLSDSQVVYLLLGMFVECFEHLESLVGSSASNVLGSEHAIAGHRDLDAITTATEMMQALVSNIQGCCKVSAESRRTISRLLESFPGDADKTLERVLLQLYQQHQNHQHYLQQQHSARDTAAAAGEGGMAGEDGEFPQKTGGPPVQTTNWWSSWARSLESRLAESNADNKEDTAAAESPVERSSSDTDRSHGRDGSDPNDLPKEGTVMDVRSFVYWYCASAQRSLRKEFHTRVQRELKSVLRYAEKLRERSSQRLLRSSKTLQDKRTKEKSYSTKLVNDTLQANQSSCDKAVNGFLKDISVWVKVWKERFQQGQDIFTGNETKPPRSSGKDSGTKPILIEPAILTAGNLDSFKIPEALIDFLSREESSTAAAPAERRLLDAVKHTGPLTKMEALNALIQCFASGRRIAEG